MLYGILGIALIVCGAVMLWNPGLVYELTEAWKHDGASEPSKFWIFSTRFGGIMCVLVGTFGLVILLLDFFNVI